MTRSNFTSWMCTIVPLVIIIVSVGVICTTIFVTRHTEGILDKDFGDIQEMLVGHLEERTFHIFEANFSIHDVAGIIGSALDKNLHSYPTIENNVAPHLFMALKLIQLASQITYVSVNKVIFSYLLEKNEIHAVFSNTSNSYNSSMLQFYTQMVDSHSGKLIGAIHVMPPIQHNGSLWFSDALKGISRSPSYGYSWGNDRDRMLFLTAPIDRFNVVALGIKLKDLINYLFSIKLHNACAFALTNDGYFIDHSTNTFNAINVTDILQAKEFIGNSCDDIIDARLLAYLSSTKHLIVKEEKYMLWIAPIHIVEVILVIVVAFPIKKFMHLLQKMMITIILLLSFFILITIIGSCVSSKIIRKLQKQKTYALDNFIKQKEATQQAERKSMNKSLAFARASHDLRASLAGITGLIKLCHDDVPPDSDSARNLVQMNSCASKLLGILNSVLDISKVEAGKMQLEDAEFNIAQAIEESVDIFHAVALSKGLEVIWDPCDFSVMMSANVKGDCRRFKQILDNLLSNAVKFTSEGHVVVRAWAMKTGSKISELTSIQQSHFPNISAFILRCLCNIGGANPIKKSFSSIYHGEGDMEFIFEVDDTGPGIPIDKRASIFENYVQVSDSSLDYEGTGLGLGIVQSYVRLMGGDIDIQEKQPGKRGSCFMFNIFLNSYNVSFDNTEEGFDPCKIPILNGLQSISYKARSKAQLNMRAMAISHGVAVDGILCLLVVHGVETRRILKGWMESLGVMVNVVQQPEKMYAELKRTVCRPFESYVSSISSCDDENELISSKDENNQALPLSMKDVSKKACLKGSQKYLLLILELGFENISEMRNLLGRLSKSAHHFLLYKVICLTDSAASCSQIPCDLILYKPIHGSRFQKILELMQEFRDINEPNPEIDQEPDNTKKLEKRTLLKQNNFVPHIEENEKKCLAGLKILLVEDTLILRQISSKLLSSYGAIVSVVDNGLEATNVVKKSLVEMSRDPEGSSRYLPFDLILMDCQMPVMDGYDATRFIRAEEKKYGVHIPIVALSAHASDEEKKSFLCGMDYHLSKPLNIDDLLNAFRLIPQTDGRSLLI